MASTVRVLQVLDFINYNSGVSSVVMNYYSHMNHEKVRCDFLLYEMPEKSWCDRVQGQGARIYAVGQPSGRKMLQFHQAVEDFFAHHAKEYDVVHVHIPNAAFVILKCAKKHGISVRILHSHNARGADGTIKKIRNYVLNKWGILYANQYFACGNAAGEYLYGKKKVRQDMVNILPNAIDLKKYAFSLESRKKIREQLGVEADEILLGHIGRFAEQKNHVQLFEIFATVRKKGINAKLVLLGDGELREYLQDRAKELKLEIIFAGIVGNAEEYLSAMDIFLLPSIYEGLPVVCVEAQASGLPCLISDCVTTEIKLTDKVYFVDNSQVEQWSRLIEELMSEKENRQIVQEMTLYDIEKQAEMLERKYFQYGQNSDSDVYL